MGTEVINQVAYYPNERVLFYQINSTVDKKEADRLNNLGMQSFDGGLVDFVLIDLKESSDFSSSARKVWVSFLKDERIKKTAIYGGNIFVRTLASFVIAATGKKNIRFFNSEAAARDWLCTDGEWITNKQL